VKTDTAPVEPDPIVRKWAVTLLAKHSRMRLAGDIMLDLAECIIRLGAATVLGGAVGLDRDLRGKPTGVRTMGIVSFGSAVIVLASQSMAPATDPSAASRVMQGIITGIGFLGAAVILRNPSGKKVHGLTTAAAIWLTACIGAACGADAWPIVAPAALFVFVLLTFGHQLERAVERKVSGGNNEPADGDS
jgi:putative Mg2+ transporter-C (MgtC) family protein